MSEASVSPAAKLDPETLAIRTKPVRAIRFRRGVIIAVAALGSVSLVVVAMDRAETTRLQRGPRRPRIVGTEQSTIDRRSERLAGDLLAIPRSSPTAAR